MGTTPWQACLLAAHASPEGCQCAHDSMRRAPLHIIRVGGSAAAICKCCHTAAQPCSMGKACAQPHLQGRDERQQGPHLAQLARLGKLVCLHCSPPLTLLQGQQLMSSMPAAACTVSTALCLHCCRQLAVGHPLRKCSWGAAPPGAQARCLERMKAMHYFAEPSESAGAGSRLLVLSSDVNCNVAGRALDHFAQECHTVSPCQHPAQLRPARTQRCAGPLGSERAALGQCLAELGMLPLSQQRLVSTPQPGACLVKQF